MKRIVSLVLVLILALSLLVGCGGAKEKEYTLAIGVATAQDGAEVASTVAAVIISDNKIAACRIDTLAIEPEITDGIAATGTYKTKAELGDSYGMLTNNDYYGSKLAEWDDQAKAFEEYVAGKTQTEVNGIAVDESGKPTDSALTAGCTVAVSDFIKAIDNAFKSEHKVAFKSASALTLGVAANGTVANEKDNNNNTTAVLSYTADFAATVMADGKVVAAIIDSSDVSADIAENGEVGAIENLGTKLEQGDSYGMLTNNDYYGSKLAEWYVQAQAYANTAVGKTAAEVAGLSTEKIEGACTIYVGGYKTALEKAASYTR